jgi:hypothetical protein
MDTSTLSSVLIWSARLWPAVLVVVILIVGRRRLGRPWAFAVFGCLACFGVQWLVGQASSSWHLQALGHASIEEELRHAILYTGAFVIVVSIVLSSIPLTWLWRIHRISTVELR